MKIFNGPGSGSRVFYRMEKKAPKAADIYLYDIIGDSWDGTTAKQFAADLKALEGIDVLNIFINSPGGSVMDGVAIYNTLIRHRARKVVNIDGLAASIASVVAMCGDEINIAKNAMMMIHNPWAFAMGEAKDFRKQADVLDQIRETLVMTYMERGTATEKQISDWMNAETWFNAEEAVAAGLADCVTQNEMQAAALVNQDFGKFRNIPAAFMERIAKAKAAPAPEGNSTVTDNPEPGDGARKPHPALVKSSMKLARLRTERAKP